MTQTDVPRRQASPFHPGLIASGATLLIGTLVTDGLYWQTLLFQWNNFSAWLLLAGLVLAGLAAIALVVDLVRGGVRKIAWLRFVGLAVAVVLAVLDAFVHSRDAYTAVVPEGITLSAVVAVLLLAIGLTSGWSLEAQPITSQPRTREVQS